MSRLAIAMGLALAVGLALAWNGESVLRILVGYSATGTLVMLALLFRG